MPFGSSQLHLATCAANVPHVSLMNYTYLATHPFEAPGLPPGPVIIMTSNSSSKKTLNLAANPNVSLLVHDWVSARPPNAGGGGREHSPVGTRTQQRSSLATMLMQMNSAAVSSISATINGEARMLEPGTREEKWCKEQHVANNTFEDEASGAAGAGRGEVLFGVSPAQAGMGGFDRSSYVEDRDARVVVVRIRDGRISDWKGGVKDWVITETAGINDVGVDGGGGPMVNGMFGQP